MVVDSSSSTSFSSSNSDIIASDYDEEVPPLSPTFSPVVIAAPIATAPAILPAQQRLSQIPHPSRGPTGRVRAKSKQQLKLESQERADATKKEETRAKREAAKARKEAKFMAPRKENVSQLEEE